MAEPWPPLGMLVLEQVSLELERFFGSDQLVRAVSRCLFSDRLRTALLDFATRIVRSIDTSISCTLSAFVPSALPARSPEPGAANNIFQYAERRGGRGTGGDERQISLTLCVRVCSLTRIKLV